MTGDRSRFGVVASIPSEIPKRQFSGWPFRRDLHFSVRRSVRDHTMTACVRIDNRKAAQSV
jgi:hypothetical protein